VDYNKFASYIKTIDNMTDGDDRLILFIVGHGGYWSSLDMYYFKLESGELIPEETLMKLLRTLGPALDFVWLFSCHSEVFGEKECGSLSLGAKEFILWCYRGDTEIKEMATQAEAFENLLGSETRIEMIKDLMTSRKNLTMFDYYPGYLDILVLGPAYKEYPEDYIYGEIFVPKGSQIVIAPL